MHASLPLPRPTPSLQPPRNSDDPVAFREDLLNIARTTLSSKILTVAKDHFSELAVDAVLRIKETGSLEAIQIMKKLGGKLHESYVDRTQCPRCSSLCAFAVPPLFPSMSPLCSPLCALPARLPVPSLLPSLCFSQCPSMCLAVLWHNLR